MTPSANLRRYGNSFGQSDRKRAKWTRGHDTADQGHPQGAGRDALVRRRLRLLQPGPDRRSPQATARVFQKAGLDFGLLYDARAQRRQRRPAGRRGRPVRDAREKNNDALWPACQFQEIVTTDPHTYNTLKNEYPCRRGSAVPAPVLHYTEVARSGDRLGQLPVRAGSWTTR